MAPVNPGHAIQWQKRPAYTVNLLRELNSLPRDDAQLVLTLRLNTLHRQLAAKRRRLVRDLTAKLFDPSEQGGNDVTTQRRSKSHQNSVGGRCLKLTESYDGYRARLRALAADETYADVHGAILGAFPFFDSIHTLCSNDPQFLPTAERPDWRTHWRPIKGAPGDYERAVERCLERLEAEEDDEDRMSEVEYGAPHVPVAGPAYPHHHQQQPPPQAGPQPSGSGSGAQAAAAAARQRALLHDAYSADEEAEAAIAYAEAHHAAAHRVPSPVPNPPQAHVYAREQSVELSNCPICQLNVSALAMDAAEEHLRQCLDGDGATVLSCPVCELRLEGMDSKSREKHVDDCCNGGAGGATTERNREHAEFYADDKTLPRDPISRDIAECGVCFDDFKTDILLVRLSCYCVYHKHCMESWWKTPGAFCPMHRDDKTAGTDPDIRMR